MIISLPRTLQLFPFAHRTLSTSAWLKGSTYKGWPQRSSPASCSLSHLEVTFCIPLSLQHTTFSAVFAVLTLLALPPRSILFPLSLHAKFLHHLCRGYVLCQALHNSHLHIAILKSYTLYKCNLYIYYCKCHTAL